MNLLIRGTAHLKVKLITHKNVLPINLFLDSLSVLPFIRAGSHKKKEAKCK